MLLKSRTTTRKLASLPSRSPVSCNGGLRQQAAKSTGRSVHLSPAAPLSSRHISHRHIFPDFFSESQALALAISPWKGQKEQNNLWCKNDNLSMLLSQRVSLWNGDRTQCCLVCSATKIYSPNYKNTAEDLECPTSQNFRDQFTNLFLLMRESGGPSCSQGGGWCRQAGRQPAKQKNPPVPGGQTTTHTLPNAQTTHYMYIVCFAFARAWMHPSPAIILLVPASSLKRRKSSFGANPATHSRKPSWPRYARMHSGKCLILGKKKKKLSLFFNCVRWWANLKGQPQVVLVTTMHRRAATGQRPMGSLALHEISKLGAKPSGHLCSLKTRTHPLSL